MELAQPFRIGLKPLDPADMFDLQGAAAALGEKRRLYAAMRDRCVMAEPATLPAQEEARDLIAANLARYHGGASEDLSDPSPLGAAALTVPDDLVLMIEGHAGWRLGAASLCFPSSWSLPDKFGHPMRRIHGPVPLDEKMETRIERIFTGLHPERPVWRGNWALDRDMALRQERPEHHRNDKHTLDAPSPVLRTEFQTLTKLPRSGAVLFTIRIGVVPLEEAVRDSRLASTLAAQYRAMQPAQRAYKGIETGGDRLLAMLDRHAAVTQEGTNG